MSDRIRWRALWEHCGARGDPLPAHDALVRAYLEPHRAYHNLRHIDDCLRQFEGVRNLAVQPDAVEWALWYHDVVYAPRAKDNEERSAEAARRACDAAGLPSAFADRVADLILATRHDAVPADPDAQLVVDIDLSILGRDDAEFDEYERSVRAEYRWVPDLLFRPGRARILRGFLDRPSIFSTAHFHSRFEEQARRNLRRSLAALGG